MDKGNISIISLREIVESKWKICLLRLRFFYLNLHFFNTSLTFLYFNTRFASVFSNFRKDIWDEITHCISMVISVCICSHRSTENSTSLCLRWDRLLDLSSIWPVTNSDYFWKVDCTRWFLTWVCRPFLKTTWCWRSETMFTERFTFTLSNVLLCWYDKYECKYRSKMKGHRGRSVNF